MIIPMTGVMEEFSGIVGRRIARRRSDASREVNDVYATPLDSGDQQASPSSFRGCAYPSQRRGKSDRCGGSEQGAPPAFRFLYIMFLALDTCFRLK
jgi:hypothetical protein